MAPGPAITFRVGTVRFQPQGIATQDSNTGTPLLSCSYSLERLTVIRQQQNRLCEIQQLVPLTAPHLIMNQAPNTSGANVHKDSSNSSELLGVQLISEL